MLSHLCLVVVGAQDMNTAREELVNSPPTLSSPCLLPSCLLLACSGRGKRSLGVLWFSTRLRLEGGTWVPSSSFPFWCSDFPVLLTLPRHSIWGRHVLDAPRIGTTGHTPFVHRVLMSGLNHSPGSGSILQDRVGSGRFFKC